MKEIPSFLKELIVKEYPNHYDLIFEFYNEKRFETFRINHLKGSVDEVRSYLESNHIEYKKWDLYNDAYILVNNDKLINSDIYKEGKIYFQSLSSMIPPLCMDLISNHDVLDMAAAPGSKTSLMSALNNNINITACEIDKIRMDRLQYNINKLGCKNVNFIRSDATKLDDYFRFDEILLDAPCSGSGTLSSYDESFDKISLKLIKNSSILQLKLLRKALTILKKGSTMVYSTCSILKEENENVIKQIQKEFKIEILPLNLNIPIDDLLPSDIKNAVTVKPSKMYEGFFIIKLRKI